MKSFKFMKNVLAAMTVMTVVLPLAASAKTVIVSSHKPSPQEVTAIQNNAFRTINNPEAGPMTFSLSKSPQTGLLEILYAPPGWPKRAWDQYKIFRMETSFDKIKDITVSGDYVVITGSLKGGADSQINAFVKRGKYPVESTVLLRQGAAPVVKDPTILDVVIGGCTYVDKASNGVFVPRYMMIFGQDKNGAFAKGLMEVNSYEAELSGTHYHDGRKDLQIGNESGLSKELFVHRNGDVEVIFDSGVSRIIGKITPSELPAKNTCKRLVVELASKLSYKHTKSLRPLLEDAMFIPVPRIAVKNNVRVGFEGQELRCEHVSSRDEVEGFTIPDQKERECESNPEQHWP